MNSAILTCGNSDKISKERRLFELFIASINYIIFAKVYEKINR